MPTTNKTYRIEAKTTDIWMQIAETNASSKAEAIRLTVGIMLSKGNALPEWTKYRAIEIK